LDKLNDPIASDIALADDFKSSSPTILWQSIKDKYN